jgi:hypothetical protein
MDYLTVDKEIPDQKYTLVSFLCPDSEIKKRELYFMNKFREYYMLKCNENFSFLQENLKENAILYDKLEQIRSVNMNELYELFLLDKKKELDEEYNEKTQNKCSIMGLKVRGSFPSIQEARGEAAKKQKNDPNHNIFICQTGYWVPFSPNIEEISNQEYANEKLNEIMREYNNQLEHKNEVWNKITKERIEKAQKEGQQSRAERETESNLSETA